MGLLDIVKNCWNNFSTTAKTGLLTAALLGIGFANPLYAGDDGVKKFKPKDFDISGIHRKDKRH